MFERKNVASLSRAFRPTRVASRAMLAATVMFGLVGCSALDVSDPTTIQDSALDNATGAEDLWAMSRFAFANASNRTAFASGVLSDEFMIDVDPGSLSSFARIPTFLDRRESVKLEAVNSNGGTGYEEWQRLRRDATIAIPRVRAFARAGAKNAMLGELFAHRGYAAVALAENTCPGFPLRDYKGLVPIFGPPLTTDQAFTSALAEFDSAATYGADSARVLYLARIGKARALLGLGNFAEARLAVASVPAGYAATVIPTNRAMSDRFGPFEDARAGVADQEGGNGLDFVSAGDPRIVLEDRGHASFGDTLNVLYAPTDRVATYPTITMASDLEARLIEAEGALNAHDGAWLTILNDLRQTKISPALPPLADPGSFAAQVDLLFRERAFWLFGTGHRLGDMRRLISRYGRAPETVLPSGTYRTGGPYGAATSLPFEADVEMTLNRAVTGCTSR